MCLVTAYQPCVTDPTHPISVYQQQQQVLCLQGQEDHLSVVAFQEELCAQLREWRESGDAILLMVDANEHVGTSPLQTKLWEQVSMSNLMTDTHLHLQLPPNT